MFGRHRIAEGQQRAASAVQRGTCIGGAPSAVTTAREAQAGLPRASAAATSWEKKLCGCERGGGGG